MKPPLHVPLSPRLYMGLVGVVGFLFACTLAACFVLVFQSKPVPEFAAQQLAGLGLTFGALVVGPRQDEAEKDAPAPDPPADPEPPNKEG